MDNETKEEKPTKMWKIEGEAFEKVKNVYAEAVESGKEAHRVADEKKAEVWAAIREALPELEGKDGLKLDTDCESIGFYVIKESRDHSRGVLAALMAAAKAS